MIKDEVATREVSKVLSIIDKLFLLEKSEAHLVNVPPKVLKQHREIYDKLKELTVNKGAQLKYFKENRKIKENEPDERSNG